MRILFAPSTSRSCGFIHKALNIHNELQLYYEHIDQNYDRTDPPEPDKDFKADVTRGRYTYYFNPITSAFFGYRYVNKNLDEESPSFSDYEVHNPRLGFSRSLYENLTLTVSGGYAIRKTDEFRWRICNT